MENKAILKEKRVECILGTFFLIPPILGVLAFVLCLFDSDSHFARLSDLSANWTNDYSGNGGAYRLFIVHNQKSCNTMFKEEGP